MSTSQHAKSVSQSRTLLTELMIPAYSNFGGKVHGGVMLSLMDKAAYACATRHSQTYCVTVAMDDIDFRYPVEVGDLVTLDATVHFVGTTSMVIGIEVHAENTVKGESHHTNTSYVTMVAQDENGVSCQVPPLLLETEAEIRKFQAAIARREARKSLRDKLEVMKTELKLEDAVSKLGNYRCIIRMRE